MCPVYCKEAKTQQFLCQVWDVNVSNKMRDAEFEAKMLLNSSEALLVILK